MIFVWIYLLITAGMAGLLVLDSHLRRRGK